MSFQYADLLFHADVSPPPPGDGPLELLSACRLVDQEVQHHFLVSGQAALKSRRITKSLLDISTDPSTSVPLYPRTHD